MLEEIMISIDYANAIRQANKLNEIADECSEIINSLKTITDKLKDYWDGEAANAFIEKLIESQKQNAKIKSEINDTAQLIKNVANAIKRADEEAARIARSKNGGGVVSFGGGGGGSR